MGSSSKAIFELPPPKRQKTQSTSHDLDVQEKAQSSSLSERETSIHEAVDADLDDDDRFFGAGLTDGEAQALDYIDSRTATGTAIDGPEEADHTVRMSSDLLRKRLAKLEKHLTSNGQLRLRYATDPQKFMDSEYELHKQIKEFAFMTEYPEYYRQFTESNGMNLLAKTLMHENTDIGAATIELLSEITDADVELSDEGTTALASAMRTSGILLLAVDHLQQLDESHQDENTAQIRTSVSLILSILDHCVLLDESFKVYLGKETSISQWLLKRLNMEEAWVQTGSVSDNKQYAAEILSILVDRNNHNIDQLVDLDATDAVLMLIAPYRKRKSANASEEEYLANIFNVLSNIVSRPSGKDRFLEGEGVELMQRLLDDAKSATTQQQALRIVLYGCSSWLGGAVCEKVVTAGLLRKLFRLFMKSKDLEQLEMLVGIFVCFFRTLNDGEAARARVINKFEEMSFQKVERLVVVRSMFATKHEDYTRGQTARMQRLDISAEERQEYALTNYLDRLEHGLSGLQLCDLNLAWLIATQPTISQLSQVSDLISTVKPNLAELLEETRPRSRDLEQMSEDDIEVENEVDMLETLIGLVNILKT